MFNTQFFTFHQTHQNGELEEVIRAEKYSIPRELDLHVESVFRTIEMPSYSYSRMPVMKLIGPIPDGPISDDLSGNLSRRSLVTYDGMIRPDSLKTYYNVGTAQGSVSSTQAVYASIQQSFSPADLLKFQNDLSTPAYSISTNIGNYMNDTKCKQNPNNCGEGNLDVEYIMSVSKVSPTTYWYADQYFDQWLLSVANTASPPLVLSVSYGSDEIYVSSSTHTAFTTQAIKLGTMGVTIFVASGDDGANPSSVRSNGVSSCNYTPDFPATNPYVTTVGATMVRSIHSIVTQILSYRIFSCTC